MPGFSAQLRNNLYRNVPFCSSEANQNEKPDQQSRSGWGGKRAGAGASLANTDAAKHGERSRWAFFPFEGGEALSPLVRNRARNLMLAERYGLLLANYPTPGTEEWREMALINGLMGLHADRIARLELSLARSVLMQTRRDLRRVKTSGAC